jgi:dipeptidyl aminopeptidase/acylaminoacyl peptidase
MRQRSLAIALLGTILVLSLGACSSSPEQAPAARTITSVDLIDRKLLFGNPSRFQGRLSPDGAQMSFRAPLNGVMNLWVAPAGNIDAARPITRNTGRGIPSHFWALDSKSILYIEDQNGDENWHLYRIDLASGQTKDLTPYPGVRANFIAQSERHPGMAVIGMNDRDERWHDTYLVDIKTGKRTLLLENNGFSQVYVDNDLQVRLGTQQTQTGGANLFKVQGDAWIPFIEIPAEDIYTTSVVGFGADNKTFYMLDSRGRNFAALTRVNLASGESNDLILMENADISDVLIHPQTHEVIAVATNTHQQKWLHTDGRYARDIQILNDEARGDIEILATTLDGEQWIIHTGPSDGSPEYVVYDRDTQTLNRLFTTNPALEGLPLAPKENVVIKARDGRTLISYLTLPPGIDSISEGVPRLPLPMVLLVHGGPWARDTAGFDAEVQWLANRGYAVLQVNFRASTGFGKEHIIAGNREWAAAMHNDLLDAVDWAVNRRVADRDRVAIMGGSYGGYATLVGLTFTPEVFACGVDIVGPSNLSTLLASIPPYWEGRRRTLVAAIGDPDTPEGQALLAERSPLNRVEMISKPLLIAQGANDPRVKQAESDQIVEAMKEKGVPVTYVLFPDEGHGFQKPENAMAFNAVAESFLEACLGGRSQPMGGDLKASSIRVVEGAAQIKGLEQALVN